MKVGKYDISVNLLSYIGGFLAAIIFLFIFWKRNSDVRYEGFCRSAIYHAMYDENGEAQAKGIEYCRNLISDDPDKATARLYLGDLLVKMKNYKEAQKEYENAATCAKAKPKEKGWAYTGAGVAAFLGSGKDTTKAAAAAQDFFRKALEADKLCIDALINMAVTEMQKGGDEDINKAEKYADQALDLELDGKDFRGIVPSIKAQEQLYIVKGMICARRGKTIESVDYFGRAKVLRQNTASIEPNQRMAMLATIADKNLDAVARKEMLSKLELNMGKFGKDTVTAYNAIGVAYASLKSEPDFATGPLASAIRNLNKAIDSDPKDLRAYYNLAAIYDDRARDIAEKAGLQMSGISGDSLPANRWTGNEKNARTNAERAAIEDIKKVFMDEENVWKKFQEKAKVQPAEKVDGKLRYLSCLRRMAYLLEDSEGLRGPVLVRATNIATELEKLDPDNLVVRVALGHLLIDKGDFVAASKEFQKAIDKGYKSPELEKLMAGLNMKPEVADVRPAEGKRSFSPRPIVGGTLKAMTAGGPPKKAVMKIDDKPVTASMTGPLGLQVLFFPGEKDLGDGEHTVYITMFDNLNQQIDFPTFKFSLDKMPPSVTLAPDVGQPLPSKPVFKMTVEDKSEVDFSSLKISLRKAAGTPAPVPLVEGGRVKKTMNDTNPPHKIGYIIDSSPFEFSPGQELTPGDYDMQITVSDMVGNVYNENKRFSVKK